MHVHVTARFPFNYGFTLSLININAPRLSAPPLCLAALLIGDVIRKGVADGCGRVRLRFRLKMMYETLARAGERMIRVGGEKNAAFGRL